LIERTIAGTVDDFWIDNIVHMPTRFFIPFFIIITISGVIVVLDLFAGRKNRALREMTAS